MDYSKILQKIINYIIKNGIPKYLKNKTFINKKFDNTKDFLVYANELVKSYHKHSFIRLYNNQEPNIESKFSYSKNIGIIKLYSFDNKDIEKYKNDIINFISNPKLEGLILDFRKHHGGNMWPLVDALSRFLDNSTLFAWSNEKVSFKDKKWWNFINGKIKINQTFIKGANINYPIAIIIGPHTASAGEFIASCFINRDNVKIFGGKTAGYLSVNNTVTIDDYQLNIPETLQTSRDGKFREYIKPDIYTSKPITEAKLWIRNN